MAFAQESTFKIPNLIGCDLSAAQCLVNITSLILPSRCGTPPSSVFNATLDTDSLKWAECACPTMVPAFEWYLFVLIS